MRLTPILQPAGWNGPVVLCSRLQELPHMSFASELGSRHVLE